MSYTFEQEMNYRLGDFVSLYRTIEASDEEFKGNLSFAVLLGQIWERLIEEDPDFEDLFDFRDIEVLEYFADLPFQDEPLGEKEVRIYGPATKISLRDLLKETAVKEDSETIAVHVGLLFLKVDFYARDYFGL